MSLEPRSTTGPLVTLVLLGLVMRIVLIAAAEHRLDADESAVGLLALQITQGGPWPMFFPGGAYNGGAAMEAYLAALLFAVLGASQVGLKCVMLAIWMLTALLFSDLARRVFAKSQALLATLVFALPSPFFLEWSLKARGGFAETVLFEVLLLWLVEPPERLRTRPTALGLAWGVAAGLGLWASEMVVPMMLVSAAWLILFAPDGQRGPRITSMASGIVLGTSPLIIFNVTHGWANLRESMLFAALTGAGESAPALTLSQMVSSADFVLGPLWLLVAIGWCFAVARTRVGFAGSSTGAALFHTGLFVVVYWWAGVRDLGIPSSRALYAIYPGIAIVIGRAFHMSGAARRRLPLGVALVWVVAVCVPTVRWMHTGQPREAGSWRGSWSLTDGAGLYRWLEARNVAVAYANHWTTQSTRFAMKCLRQDDPRLRRIHVTNLVPQQPKDSGVMAAVVARRGTDFAAWLDENLPRQDLRYERSEWQDHVIFWRLDARRLSQRIGLPASIDVIDWLPTPSVSDGFN